MNFTSFFPPADRENGPPRRMAAWETQSRCAGITLLELLVVIAVMSLLVAAGAAMLRPASPSLQLQATSDELVSDLRLARALAARERRQILFQFHADEHRWQWLPDSGRNWPAEMAVAVKKGHADQEVAFFPDGSSSGGTVVLSLGDAHRVVVVDWLTGRVRVDE